MIKKLKYIIDTIKTYNERVRLSKELESYISSIQGMFRVIPHKISHFDNNIAYTIPNIYFGINMMSGMNARAKIREMSNYLYVRVTSSHLVASRNIVITYEPYSADIDRFLMLKKIQGEY